MNKLILGLVLVLAPALVQAQSGKNAYFEVRKTSCATSAENINPYDGTGLLYWVSASTAASYAELRDSATANSSSDMLFPRYTPASTGQAFLQFDPPLRFYNGLSLTQGGANTGGGTNGACVGYSPDN